MAKCSHFPRFACAWIVMVCFVCTDATFFKLSNEYSLRLKHKSSASTHASDSLAQFLLGFSSANFPDTRWVRQDTSTHFCNNHGHYVLDTQNPRSRFTSQSKILNRVSPAGRNGLQMKGSHQDDQVTTRVFCDKTVLGEGGTLSVEPALISIRGAHIVEVLLQHIRLRSASLSLAWKSEVVGLR